VWAAGLPGLLREPRAALLTFLFVLIAAALRWGPYRLLQTASIVAIAVLASELPLEQMPSASGNVGSLIAAYLPWGIFALFASGLLWLLVRTETAQKWESTAEAAQRAHARIAAELHDTVAQSLYTIECRLEGLPYHHPGLPPAAKNDLATLQELMHTTEMKLRDVVRQGRPVDLGSQTLLDYLRTLVAEFEKETGIAVRLSCQCGEFSPQPAVSTEIVRIIQEALMNIRKHSGARQVSIECSTSRGRWQLRIDDDGRGFDFAGRLGTHELENTEQGPFVIRERVSSLGGELVVQSMPGRGARLEIALPKDALG